MQFEHNPTPWYQNLNINLLFNEIRTSKYIDSVASDSGLLTINQI